MLLTISSQKRRAAANLPRATRLSDICRTYSCNLASWSVVVAIKRAESRGLKLSAFVISSVIVFTVKAAL